MASNEGCVQVSTASSMSGIAGMSLTSAPAVEPTMQTKYSVSSYTFDALPLQHGGQFGPVTLAYETWGTLNAQGDNAILITHALTGSRGQLCGCDGTTPPRA